jgi:hypothetical protein
MIALIGFFVMHLLLVLTTGVINHIRSMVTGWYTLQEATGSVVTEPVVSGYRTEWGLHDAAGAQARPEHRFK